MKNESLYKDAHYYIACLSQHIADAKTLAEKGHNPKAERQVRDALVVLSGLKVILDKLG